MSFMKDVHTHAIEFLRGEAECDQALQDDTWDGLVALAELTGLTGSSATAQASKWLATVREELAS